MSSENPRHVFVKSFIEMLDQNSNTLTLQETQCKQNHPFTTFISDATCTMFNIFMKNFTSEENSKIHQQRKRNNASSDPRKSSLTKKLKKLTC